MSYPSSVRTCTISETLECTSSSIVVPFIGMLPSTLTRNHAPRKLSHFYPEIFHLLHNEFVSTISNGIGQMTSLGTPSIVHVVRASFVYDIIGCVRLTCPCAAHICLLASSTLSLSLHILLESFDISNNFISGALPETMKNMKNLSESTTCVFLLGMCLRSLALLTCCMCLSLQGVLFSYTMSSLDPFLILSMELSKLGKKKSNLCNVLESSNVVRVLVAVVCFSPLFV